MYLMQFLPRSSSSTCLSIICIQCIQQFIFFSNSLQRERDSTRDFITQKLLPCDSDKNQWNNIERKEIVRKHLFDIYLKSRIWKYLSAKSTVIKRLFITKFLMIFNIKNDNFLNSIIFEKKNLFLVNK